MNCPTGPSEAGHFALFFLSSIYWIYFLCALIRGFQPVRIDLVHKMQLH